MRLLVAGLLVLPAPAVAEAYHDLGKPEQCGAYAEAAYDRDTWFPGGEGGLISLTDPQSVRGLNALLFEGMVTEEGFSDPAGRILALRGPLATAEGPTGQEVLVIMTDSGVRLLQRCP
jgi:hypothetical protein